MIYVKSFLAGLAALIMLAALIVGVLFFAPPVMAMLTPSSSQGGAGWTVGAFACPMRPVLIGALVTFAVAFYWTYKRLSRASDPGS